MFGMGSMDPKKMEKMMKKLNMNVRKIDAKEVVIKQDGKDTIISNPDVMIVNMSGRDVFQITGEISEKTTKKAVSEEDVKLVMGQTGKPHDEVVKKLEELDNDLAKAIKDLKGEE